MFTANQHPKPLEEINNPSNTFIGLLHQCELPCLTLNDFFERVYTLKTLLDNALGKNSVEFLSDRRIKQLESAKDFYTEIFNCFYKFTDHNELKLKSERECDKAKEENNNEYSNLKQNEFLSQYRKLCQELKSLVQFDKLSEIHPELTATIRRIESNWNKTSEFAALRSSSLSGSLQIVIVKLAEYNALIVENINENSGIMHSIYQKLFANQKVDAAILKKISLKLVENLEAWLNREKQKIADAMIARLRLQPSTVLREIRDIQNNKEIENYRRLKDDVLLNTINKLKKNELVDEAFYTRGGASYPTRRTLTARTVLKFNDFIISYGTPSQRNELIEIYDLERQCSGYIPIGITDSNIIYYGYDKNNINPNSYFFSVDFAKLEKFQQKGQPLFAHECVFQQENPSDEVTSDYILPPKRCLDITNQINIYFHEGNYQKLFLENVKEKINTCTGVNNIDFNKLCRDARKEVVSALIDQQIEKLSDEQELDHSQYNQLQKLLYNNYIDRALLKPVSIFEVMEDARFLLQIINTANNINFTHDESIRYIFILIANNLHLERKKFKDGSIKPIHKAHEFTEEISSWANALQIEAQQHHFSEFKARTLRRQFIENIQQSLKDEIITDSSTITQVIINAKINNYRKMLAEKRKEIAKKIFKDLNGQNTFLKSIAALKFEFEDNKFIFDDICTNAYRLTMKNLKIIEVNADKLFKEEPLHSCFLDIANGLLNTCSEKLNFDETVVQRAINYTNMIKEEGAKITLEAEKYDYSEDKVKEVYIQFVDKAKKSIEKANIIANSNEIIAARKGSLSLNAAKLNLLVDIHSKNLFRMGESLGEPKIINEFKKLAKEKVKEANEWQSNPDIYLGIIKNVEIDVAVKVELRDLVKNEIKRIQQSHRGCFSFLYNRKTENKIQALKDNLKQIKNQKVKTLIDVKLIVDSMLNNKSITRSRNCLDIFSLFGSTTSDDLNNFAQQLNNKIQIR